jgi:acyl carrier protein
MNIVVVAQEAAGVKTVQLVEQSPHHLAAVLTGSEHDETNGRGVTVRAAARKLGVPVLPAARVQEMSGMDADIPSRITEMIRDRLSVDVPAADTDLIESGLLDSLALVMLIAAIEETFACELPLEVFDIECFRSVERIFQFMHSSGILEARGS